MGLHSLQDRGADTQTFAIRAVCPHPDYDEKTMENDILLLQVGFALAVGKGWPWGWRSGTAGSARKRRWRRG